MSTWKQPSLNNHANHLNNLVNMKPVPIKAQKAKRIAADMTINMVAITAIAVVGFATLQTLLA